MGWSFDRDTSWYDTAQICLNGHVINSMMKSSPETSKKFCLSCGASTISECRHCNSPIKGYHHVPGVIGFPSNHAPRFCDNCGSPYPWTSGRIQAAQELVDELGISPDDSAALKEAVVDIVTDTPRTTAAALRFKRIAGQAGSLEILRDILGEAASATAKKIIWPEDETPPKGRKR